MGNEETLIPIRILPKQNFEKSNTLSSTKKRRRDPTIITESALQFECKLCKIPLGSSSDGIVHFRSLHPENELQIECSLKCNQNPSPEKRIRENESTPVLSQRVICRLCDFQAYSSDQLELHIKNCHIPLSKSIGDVGKRARGSGRMLSCPICFKRFIKESKFDAHAESHTIQDVVEKSYERL
ncbi:unnamed protein product [Oikopleura dioica]|uniref:C2H2-type domain-containing protein n=1 Tax=Oikopleura dioica TaxID=34765 RepID=E4X3K4_OIKDI|nr:unnamed protein product [Oikopleura dioica]